MNKIISLALLGTASLWAAHSQAYNCTGVAQYVDGSSYTAGAIVQNQGSAYQCTVVGWCSVGGPYAPGVGWAYTNAWQGLGACDANGSSSSVQSSTSSSLNSSISSSVVSSSSSSISSSISSSTSSVVSSSSVASSSSSSVIASGHEACRPDGLYRTPGVDVPYCSVYDNGGREKMAIDRRIIGYFPSWRLGANGTPRYLAKDIPWGKITHINYAFAHIENNKISVGNVSDPNNASTGRTWPGVAGAEMDPSLPYNGHFNLLSKFKKQYPQVKTMISIGGWAETGGYFDSDGNRVANGGFYTLTDSQANINTFADSVVEFLRTYNFDGADIDYEYATSMKDAGNPADWSIANARRATLMKNYVALMKTLREKLDIAGAADGKHYLLTVAAPSSGYLLRGMDMYQVTQYLDYVNIMSYDLHGAWNEFVGPQAPLFDDGNDGELKKWSFYSAYGIGYLNTDWGYHYFRGSMPAGRINIGVPYYTRGWRDVNGGVNGMWGTTPTTSECAVGLTVCGKGAVGIDNIWHDVENGKEVAAGANPLWHAKNLERNIAASYLPAYNLSAANLQGTYQRFYDPVTVSPWLWNANTKVFLSTEDEQSLSVKADYVIDKGIGGIMFWELSGDFACPDDPSKECTVGDTMTNLLYEKFANTSVYGARKANRTMPSETLAMSYSLGDYPVGDSNFPITGKLTLTNNSALTIPGGAVFEFDYGTSDTGNIGDQSGLAIQTIEDGHSGDNSGTGLDSDFNRARFSLPSYDSMAPGTSKTFTFTQKLPTSMYSNWTLTFAGKTYALSFDYARGATEAGSSSSASSSSSSSTSSTSSGGSSSSSGSCTAGVNVYPNWTQKDWAGNPSHAVGGDKMAHQGSVYRANWWTNSVPGSDGSWTFVCKD